MKQSLSLGSVLTLISALTYAILAAMVKSLNGEVKTPVLVNIQMIACLLLFIPILFHRGTTSAKKIISSKKIKHHILRTLFSLGISYFLFSAVLFIPLVNAVLLANTAPLIVPFIAYLFFSQAINVKLFFPILVGFVGIILVLNPTPALFHPAALLAFGAGVCMASSMLLVRETVKTDSSLTGLFYYFLFGSIFSSLFALPFWKPISFELLLALCLLGVLFYIVQISLTYALQFAPTEIVSTLYYSNIIFAGLISIFYWKMPVTWMITLGIALTLLGGILTIREQARKNTLCCPVE